MIEARLDKREFRYRLYFWLMDVCLLFAAVGLFDWFVDPYDPGNWPVWYLALAIVTMFFNGIVPLFLVLARFMRDDYSEALWRRSLVILAYGAAVGPVVLTLAGWGIYFFLRTIDLTVPSLYLSIYDALFVNKLDPFIVMARVWLSFMLLFVGVFQFLRWRDSR